MLSSDPFAFTLPGVVGLIGVKSNYYILLPLSMVTVAHFIIVGDVVLLISKKYILYVKSQLCLNFDIQDIQKCNESAGRRLCHIDMHAS